MPILYCADERGYSEQIRLMLAEAGIKYDEKVVSEQQFAKEGKLIFNKLPMMSWDGFNLCESAAILEHIAVKADAGKCFTSRVLVHTESPLFFHFLFLKFTNHIPCSEC
eukprot:m.119792 g.119792  ORF g.119792 m.119792 type:complete len:109 (+) comp15480_c1_seq1:438-764(+)